MLKIKYVRYYFVLLSIVIFLIDQFTKHIIDSHHKTLINKNIIIFNIDYVKNYGASFNIFTGSRIFLSLISIIISILLLYIILNKHKINYITLTSYSFILGGTLGNGIDRISKGFVIDFINLDFINFPVFNIADISINLGVLLLIYSFIKYKY